MHVSRWLCLAALMIGTAAQAQEGASLAVAAGQRGGDAYSAAGSVCRDVNETTPHVCTILETDGTVDSLYALNLRDAQLAILQQDVLRAAWEGVDDIPGDYSSLRAVAVLYPSTLTIVTRADSPVRRFGDLIGARVAVGERFSGSSWTFRMLLKTTGLDEGGVTVVSGASVHHDADLCDGRVDAVAMMTGHPSIMLSRLAETCPIRLVPVEAGAVAALVAHDPGYRPAMVPAEPYGFLSAPTPSVGTDTLLVAPTTLPDGWVADMLTAIFRHPQGFRARQGALAPRSVGEACALVPCHEQALRLRRLQDLH